MTQLCLLRKGLKILPFLLGGRYLSPILKDSGQEAGVGGAIIAQERAFLESSSPMSDAWPDIGTAGYNNSKKIKLLSQESKRHFYLANPNKAATWENTILIQERFTFSMYNFIG